MEFEVRSQHFRQSEYSMAVRRGFEHLLLNEFGPEQRALGAATGTEAPRLAAQRQELLGAAVTSPPAVMLLEALLVGGLELVEVMIESREERGLLGMTRPVRRWFTDDDFEVSTPVRWTQFLRQLQLVRIVNKTQEITPSGTVNRR